MPCLLVCVESEEHRKDTNIIDTNLVFQTRKLYALERYLVVQKLDRVIQPIKSWPVDMSCYQEKLLHH